MSQKKFKTSKLVLNSLVLAGALGGLSVNRAQAQSFQIGGHVGAQGLGQNTKMGLGADLVFVPQGRLGLWVDASFASFNGVKYFSTSPSVVYYLSNADQLKLGLLAGVGFHKAQHSSLKFGANLGAVADYYVIPSLSIGVMGRYQPIFDSADAWGVFLTLKLAFQTGSDW